MLDVLAFHDDGDDDDDDDGEDCYEDCYFETADFVSKDEDS